MPDELAFKHNITTENVNTFNYILDTTLYNKTIFS